MAALLMSVIRSPYIALMQQRASVSGTSIWRGEPFEFTEHVLQHLDRPYRPADTAQPTGRRLPDRSRQNAHEITGRTLTKVSAGRPCSRR